MNNDIVKYNFPYLLVLAMTSALGGFLFGYDWVVIGGTKPFYELFFDIKDNATLQGWAMSSALVGCIIGAMLSSVVSDRFGRKNPLILAALLFLVSAYGSGAVNDFNSFIVYRLIGGVGIGLASTLSPLYIAEIAPAKYRGAFVAINQLTIVIGILSAQICNYLIAEPIPEAMTSAAILQSWNGTTGWRWMFWAELIPAFIFFVTMFLVPKSPRFLVKNREEDVATVVLSKIGGPDFASQEIKHIQASFKIQTDQNNTVTDLLQPGVRSIMVIGVVIAVFQQWCGINIIFNYAEEIFSAAGYSMGDMLFNIVITGSVNLLFTLVAMRTVDSWGRKKLMLFGSAGLALIYLMVGISYYLQWTGWPVLVLVILAIAVYSMSLAPITWVVLSEIFPNRMRGVAMSIATLALWIGCFVLTFTFPMLNTELGTYGTFWLYSFICVLGFLFIRNKLPETKGKTLEEIEQELDAKTS